MAHRSSASDRLAWRAPLAQQAPRAACAAPEAPWPRREAWCRTPKVGSAGDGRLLLRQPPWRLHRCVASRHHHSVYGPTGYRAVGCAFPHPGTMQGGPWVGNGWGTAQNRRYARPSARRLRLPADGLRVHLQPASQTPAAQRPDGFVFESTTSSRDQPGAVVSLSLKLRRRTLRKLTANCTLRFPVPAPPDQSLTNLGRRPGAASARPPRRPLAFSGPASQQLKIDTPSEISNPTFIVPARIRVRVRVRGGVAGQPEQIFRLAEAKRPRLEAALWA
eukprot:scaffold86570_cov48-Phaeocystis_antarctica.AAC.1